MRIRIAAIAAAASLVLAADARAEICGDVNASGSLNTSDALLVLKGGVGQEVTLTCPSIGELATCQGQLTDTGNLLFSCTEDKQECFAELASCQEQTCGNNEAESPELCDGPDLDGESCASRTPETPYGNLLCNDMCGFDTSGCKARFEASELTILDHKTGLEWERKNDADGMADAGDPSDADNTYTWGSTPPPYPPDGTLFLDFLAKLNGGLGVHECLADHCDWRIPSEAELLSIVDLTIPDCGTEETPCIDPVFLPIHGFAQANWSSTTFSGNPTGAREVYLYTGDTFPNTKSFDDPARAVRTASLP